MTHSPNPPEAAHDDGLSGDASPAASAGIISTTVRAAAPAGEAIAAEAAEVPEIPGLSLPQRKALAALLAGKSARAAAGEAGVDRTTVYRWQSRDLDFVAALNAWRRQSRQAAVNILQLAAEDAARTLLKAVRRGDVRAAIAVAKGMGVLAPHPIGPTTRQAVGQAIEREAVAERYDLLKSRTVLRRHELLLSDDYRAQVIREADKRFEPEPQQHEAAAEAGEQAGGTTEKQESQ